MELCGSYNIPPYWPRSRFTIIWILKLTKVTSLLTILAAVHLVTVGGVVVGPRPGPGLGTGHIVVVVVVVVLVEVSH